MKKLILYVILTIILSIITYGALEDELNIGLYSSCTIPRPVGYEGSTLKFLAQEFNESQDLSIEGVILYLQNIFNSPEIINVSICEKDSVNNTLPFVKDCETCTVISRHNLITNNNSFTCDVPIDYTANTRGVIHIDVSRNNASGSDNYYNLCRNGGSTYPNGSMYKHEGSLSNSWTFEPYDLGLTLVTNGTPAGDVTPPIITIVTPSEGQIITDDYVFINVSIDENGDCWLNQSEFSLNTSTLTTFDFWETTLENNNNYSVNVTCNDTANNQATTILNFRKQTPEVIVTFPLENSFNRSNPAQIFYNHNFDALQCILYNNLSGTYENVNNISSGEVNITENITIQDTIFRFNYTYALYRFEENGGSTAIDQINGNNGSINGALYNSSKLGNNTGNHSLNFTTDFIQIPYASYMSFGSTQDFSISAWVQSDLIDGNYHMILDTRDGGSDGVFLAVATGDLYQLNVNGIGFTSGTLITSGWHFVVASVDRDSAINSDLYIDGIAEGVGAVTSGVSVATTSSMFIGRRGFSPGTYWQGRIDEVQIYNKSLNSSEILELYHFGVTKFINQTTQNFTTINLSLNATINHSLNHTLPTNARLNLSYIMSCENENNVFTNSTIRNFEYDDDISLPSGEVLEPEENVTINALVNITISINETIDTCLLNDTGWVLNFSNGTYWHWKDTGVPNGIYHLNITCIDFSENQGSRSPYIFGKDRQFPTIQFNNPSSLNTSKIQNLGTLPLNFIVYDDVDLFNVHYNITSTLTGNLEYSNNLNLSGYNASIIDNVDSSNFTEGNSSYYLSVRVCDSHTKNKIKDASVIKEKDKLKFQMDDGTLIQIQSKGGQEKSTSYEKLSDRYTFGFSYTSNTPNKRYEIKSDKNIIFRPSSPYKGHFIVNNKYWVDFETDGDVIVEEIYDEEENKSKYWITVEHTGTDIEFRSIGELNCFEQVVQFELTEETQPYGLGIIDASRWFNADALNLNTTSGALFFFFITFILIALIIYSEIIKIPALFVLDGVLTLFYSILIFTTISAVFGAVILVFAILLLIRGVMLFND